jgi:hypothetical protein
VDAIRGLLSKVDEEETIAKSVVSPPSVNAWSADVRGEVVLDCFPVCLRAGELSASGPVGLGRSDLDMSPDVGREVYVTTDNQARR